MANTLAPFGFREYNAGGGASPTYAQSTRRIAASYGTAIYFGDPVVPVTGTANGYIQRATTDATTILAGIFVGCQYLSVSQKRVVWSNYFPAADVNTAQDVIAYVSDSPNTRFLVQANGTAFYNASATSSVITSLPIGQYATFNMGTGNSATGISGAYLDAVSTTAANPFVILDYVFFPPGANGTDPSTNYPYVVVGFNNEILRTNGAGPTGIS